jgi:hypothetical protein
MTPFRSRLRSTGITRERDPALVNESVIRIGPSISGTNNSLCGTAKALIREPEKLRITFFLGPMTVLSIDIFRVDPLRRWLAYGTLFPPVKYTLITGM